MTPLRLGMAAVLLGCLMAGSGVAGPRLGPTPSMSRAIPFQAVLAAQSGDGRTTIPVLGPAQTDFMMRCGGCHGLQGASVPRVVPTLKSRVGYFLCLPEGREYLVRLPNVALVSLDDEKLARLMNFVIYDLGAESTPPSVRPFTAEEVGALRAKPLTRVSLKDRRALLVAKLIRECGAPASLREYDPARERR